MITKKDIQEFDSPSLQNHKKKLTPLVDSLQSKGFDTQNLLKKIGDFQIAIPSWALGTGGTRFGRFPEGGEPRSLEEKIMDIGLLHKLNCSSDSVSLHIPWDIPSDLNALIELAGSQDIHFDAVNSNTFQDQEGDEYSYKFGSLSHTDLRNRDQAIEHNKQVIDYGIQLGSKALTVWLADGSCFPGQNNLREALERTIESLTEIYNSLPPDWKMLIEYKPYEPNFYSTVIQDWGTSHLIASKLGPKANCLVDIGHHLPNTNMEQIIATLMMEEKLGGFHFNDSKFGDDDLTAGSIKPYQLFLIFNELLDGLRNKPETKISWMIDASHNVKDPLEDLIQSVEAIKLAFTQALIIDNTALRNAQDSNDPVQAQEVLQEAFRTDIRPLLAESRRIKGGALNPIQAFRHFNIRNKLIKERGVTSTSSGL